MVPLILQCTEDDKSFKVAPESQLVLKLAQSPSGSIPSAAKNSRVLVIQRFQLRKESESPQTFAYNYQ